MKIKMSKYGAALNLNVLAQTNKTNHLRSPPSFVLISTKQAYLMLKYDRLLLENCLLFWLDNQTTIVIFVELI